MSELRDHPRAAPETGSRRAIPLGLALLGLLASVAQRPGEMTSDTKIDLHVDPWGFLGDVASVWTNTGALGEVQGGQYVGYLFPMGPFFAFGEVVGLPDWLVQRLFAGALLALAAWGTVRLLDALLDRPRGVASVVAGLMVMFNPYTVTYLQRTSVTLLGLAALPWLLLAVHRGLRDARGWWWPAAVALLIASAGAGVNAAVTAWVLLGPLALAGYERLIGAVDTRALRDFGLRAGALSLVASAWWVVPVLVQVGYGIDFLRFTEQPGAIWSSTSLTESLRGMGYWPSYLGLGFGSVRPYYSGSPMLLFDPVVVVSTLVVPALALGGFWWARRWRYGPFFLALVLLGLLVMSVGFPPGTPLRLGATFVYNHVSPVQFLRTTHKAGPLVVLGLACLAGVGAGALARRVGRRGGAALAVAGALLLAVSVWPLTTGRAIDAQTVVEGVPATWQRTAEDLDRRLATNTRAVVLPGQLLAFYRWGHTVDPILPALTDRPVATRSFVPRADLHAADLLWTIDALVGQERLVPGQLRPLLALIGTGSVVSASDDLPERSGGPAAADASRALAGQGLGDADAAYGAKRRFSGRDGRYVSSRSLPEVRRYDLAGARGIVRVEPAGPATIVDGSADALTAMAAFGALPAGLPIFYAADRNAEDLRAMAGAGAELVVSDSNRRRVFVPARLRQNLGATLGAADPISEDAAVLDPFTGTGEEARTVAVLDGARYVRAPFSPGFVQFPESRPYAALDGSARTAWLADTHLEEDRRWIEIGFDSPRDVTEIELLPVAGSQTAVTGVEIGDRSYPIEPGWNRIELGLEDVDSLRLLMRSDTPREDVSQGIGLAELRIPGLRVEESLRPPTLIESALRGRPLERAGLTYLFSRTTGDRPYRRDTGRRPVRTEAPGDGEDPDALRIRDAEDGERELARIFRPPAERSYSVDSWTSISPDAQDSEIDRLAGMVDAPQLRSSGRFQGLARHRASSAFDGDPSRAWVADRLEGAPPWVEWRTARPRTLRSLRVRTATDLPAGRPTVVRLTTRGASDTARAALGATDRDDAIAAVSSGRLRVGPTGTVTLSRGGLTGRRFRLTVLEVEQPAAERGDTPATVAIADIEGAGVPRVRVPSAGRLSGRCGDAVVRVAGRRIALRVEGGVSTLERGLPLRAAACGAGKVRLEASEHRVTTTAGVARVDHLRLRSPAPQGIGPARGGGVVLDPGEAGRGRHEGVRVRVDGPAWLVLGESYNSGWRAACDGADLGEPVVIDGYANGWRAPRGCRDVELAFAPQRAATAGYAVSALAWPALLGLLLVGGLRRRRGGAGVDPVAPRDSDGPARWARAGDAATPWPWRRAVLAGLAAALAFGFLFALRAGPPIGLGVGLILWRGVGSRALLATAVGLLGVVVPAVYLIFGPEDRGGYNSAYAQDLLGAHWVGVAAFVLLALALARSLSRATARRDGPAHGPPARPRPRSRA